MQRFVGNAKQRSVWHSEPKPVGCNGCAFHVQSNGNAGNTDGCGVSQADFNMTAFGGIIRFGEGNAAKNLSLNEIRKLIPFEKFAQGDLPRFSSRAQNFD